RVATKANLGTTAYGLWIDAAGAGTTYSAIFNTGNVGIGVSDPETTLEVAGDISVTNNGNESIRLDDGGSIYFNDSTLGEYARIDADYSFIAAGSFGVGTFNPDYTLSVSHDDGLDIFALLSEQNNQPYTNFATAETF